MQAEAGEDCGDGVEVEQERSDEGGSAEEASSDREGEGHLPTAGCPISRLAGSACIWIKAQSQQLHGSSRCVTSANAALPALACGPLLQSPLLSWRSARQCP